MGIKVLYGNRQSEQALEENIQLLSNGTIKTLCSLFCLGGEFYDEIEELFAICFYNGNKLDQKLDEFLTDQQIKLYACYIGNYP